MPNPKAWRRTGCPFCSRVGTRCSGCRPEPVLSQSGLWRSERRARASDSVGPIEITIVGDVDENAAIAAVAESFGALPARSLTGLASPDARNVTFRSDLTPILLKHDGPAGQSTGEVGLANDRRFRLPRTRPHGAVEDVLDIMLRESVREKLGDSYVPSDLKLHVAPIPGFRLYLGRRRGRSGQGRRGAKGDRRCGCRASLTSQFPMTYSPAPATRISNSSTNPCVTICYWISRFGNDPKRTGVARQSAPAQGFTRGGQGRRPAEAGSEVSAARSPAEGSDYQQQDAHNNRLALSGTTNCGAAAARL